MSFGTVNKIIPVYMSQHYGINTGELIKDSAMTDELAYAILGIISIYGACAGILAFRLIRSNRQAKKRLQSIERAKTAAAMEQLLAEAYRILNNQTHGSTRR